MEDGLRMGEEYQDYLWEVDCENGRGYSNYVREMAYEKERGIILCLRHLLK